MMEWAGCLRLTTSLATGAKWYEQEIISDVMRHFVHVQRGTYLKDTVSHLSYEIVRQGIELQIATGNSMLCKYADSILALLTDTSHDIPECVHSLPDAPNRCQ
jgi:hypothetical protein